MPRAPSLSELLVALRRAQQVELLPPRPPQAVAAFETTHGIQLPDDYRRFLTSVCDGILLEGEPWLFSLDEVALVLDQGSTHPAQVFPYDDAQARRLVDTARSSGLGGLLKDPAFMSQQVRGPHHGCLPLTDHGDGEACVLVVTGPQRGRMWRIGPLDLPELPATYGVDRGTAAAWIPLGFSDWLPYWSWQFLGV